LILIVIPIFFIIGCFSTGSFSQEKSNNEEFNEALEYFNNKQYRSARLTLQKILHKNQCQLDALSLLGDVYIAKNNLKKAIEPFEKSINCDSTFALGYLKLGVIWYNLALESEVPKPEYLNKSKHCTWKSIEYRMNLNKAQESEAHVQMAHLYIWEKSYPSASFEIQLALKCDSTNFNAHYWAAFIASQQFYEEKQQRMFEYMLSEIRWIIDNPSGHAEELFGLSKACFKTKMGFERLNSFNFKAIKFPYIQYTIAEIPSLLNLTVKKFEELQSKSPHKYEAYYILGNYYLLMGDFDKAIDNYERANKYTEEAEHAIRIIPSVVSWWQYSFYYLAIASELNGIDRVILKTFYQKATEAHQSYFIDCYIRVGEIEHEQGNFLAALDNYYFALFYYDFSNTIYFPDFQSRLFKNIISAIPYLNENEKELYGTKILPHMEKICAGHGTLISRKTENYLARAYLELGKKQKALALAKENVEMTHRISPYCLETLADVYIVLGKRKDAIKILNELIENFSNNEKYIKKLAAVKKKKF